MKNTTQSEENQKIKQLINYIGCLAIFFRQNQEKKELNIKEDKII